MPELNNAKFAFDNAIKLLNDNNLKESVEQLNEIIKIEPNHIKSLNLLGDIYIKLNKPKESLHFVNKVLNIEKFNKLNLEKKYKYLHGYGLSPFESQSENRDVYVGADLLAIQDQRFDDIHIEKVARRLIRSAIDYQLDGKVLNSRKLYQQYLASTKSDSNIGQC